MSQGPGPLSPRFKDLVGVRFERLVVKSYLGLNSSKRKRSQWLCICDCGNEKIATARVLIAGQSRSCGCLTREINVALHTRHGMYQSLEYQSWANAIQRCTNPKTPDYHNYGGRGVKVCERWIQSFENFLSDMGVRPKGCNSLDRFPNPYGDYEPGNCRWANPAQQGVNTRRNVFFDYNGKRLCLSEWARECGIKRPTIEGRLRRGWSFERAITATPNHACYAKTCS